MQIITSSDQQSNSNFSKSTNASSVTPRKLKLCIADLAYLKILRHFHGVTGKTYLKKAQWLLYLVKFGGKAVHYRKQLARWAKMRKMGISTMALSRGNRNKEYDHRITELGLEVLRVFEAKLNEKLIHKRIKKTAPRKSPNDKKRHLENEKTAPPLSHVQSMKENMRDAFCTKCQEPEEEHKKGLGMGEIWCYLKSLGFFDIEKIMILYDDELILRAIAYVQTRKVKNEGKYLRQILKDFDAEARRTAFK